MSSLTVYVGPFARVPGVAQAESETSRRCSAQCGTAANYGTKFCSACGAPITTKATRGNIVRLQNSMLPDDFLDELVCPVHCAGASEFEAIVLPNTRFVGHRMYDSDAPVKSLVNVDCAAELTKFGEMYGDKLHGLETTYGVTVTLDWGVVAYAF